MARFIITVLDSVGAGALPDAADYDSVGANTLGHIAASAKMNMPNMQRLGLGNILPLYGIAPASAPAAAWGKMAAASAGMDTTCGHWEIAGIVMDKRLPVYPKGFPDEITDKFCNEIGSGILGNCPASGTEIIQDLGPEHMATGKPIIYTSADSVFQIAAHEEVISPERLYELCRIARNILRSPHNVGRVIARPFLGDEQNGFVRTENRRDFSLDPPDGCLLQRCRESGVPVTVIGKIFDVFAGMYIDKHYPGHNNEQSGESLIAALNDVDSGLIFANFVDFDTEYGHRNDVDGYRMALEMFDAYLPGALAALRDDDIFVICADHGNDPVMPSSDHNREYVPLLVYGKKVRCIDLGIRATFADLGQTAAEYLRVDNFSVGTSFLSEIVLDH